MTRMHEELLPFVSLEETWKEVVAGLEENDKENKFFSGCYERAMRDLNMKKKKMKRLRRIKKKTHSHESLMFDGNLSKQINVNVRITSTA